MDEKGKIFVALDGLDKERACNLVLTLTNSHYSGSIAGFKIHDLWDKEGPGIIRDLKRASVFSFFSPVDNIWVDLKLHDVPEIVGLRAKAVKEAKAEFITVHADGGIEMMKEAVVKGPSIIAIPRLISHTEDETHLSCGQPTKAAVLLRAQWAKLANVWGVVCSSHEVEVLANQPSLATLARIVDTDASQKHVDTPKAAFEAGANYIVVGSEITKADNPVNVLGQITEQIASIPE